MGWFSLNTWCHILWPTKQYTKHTQPVAQWKGSFHTGATQVQSSTRKKVCHFSVVWPSLCLTQWAKMLKQQGRTETSMTHNHLNLCQFCVTTICRIHYGQMIKKDHHKVPWMSIVNIARTSSCRVLYMLNKSGGLPANIRKLLGNIHFGLKQGCSQTSNELDFQNILLKNRTWCKCPKWPGNNLHTIQN